MSYVLDVVVWTCVVIFVVTSVIAVLALLGILRLGGGSQELNEYFIKRLFAALLIELIGTSVAIYASYANGLKDPFQNSEKSVADLKGRVTNVENVVAAMDKSAGKTPAAFPVSTKWELVRTGDCYGLDVDSSGGPIPRENLCNSSNANNVTAVCWDGGAYKNGATAWCTYKKVNINSCNGGSAPGQMYKCNR